MVLVSAPLIATYSAACHKAWSGIVSFQSSSVRSSDIQRALGLKSDHRLPASLLTHTHTQHASMWMMMATTTTALHLWQVHFFLRCAHFFAKAPSSGACVQLSDQSTGKTRRAVQHSSGAA